MLEHYKERLLALPDLHDDQSPQSLFELWSDPGRGLNCYYAPFEHVNKSAELVLIGITPGSTQMNRALTAAAKALRQEQNMDSAIAQVKRVGSFSGSMRQPLIDMLDRLGYQRRLKIASCSSLWGADYGRVHFTSLLRNPVFLKGKDYRGNPNPLKHPKLRQMLMETLVPELNALPASTLLVPLGEKVLSVLVELKKQGLVKQHMPSLHSLHVAPPHPSGANRESVELVLRERYPEEGEYADLMYRQYIAKRTTLDKPGKLQDEGTYKKVRQSRWCEMRLVRLAHGLSV